MTDNKQKRAAKKDLEPLDFTKPVYVAVYRTPKTQVVEVFTNAGEAEDWADAKATGAKTSVAVFGPQFMICSPPAERAVRSLVDFGPIDVETHEPAVAAE